MKILKLTANNFKKLSAVEITPDGNMVIISGKNAAGKSSVLDAIEAALCGGRNLPKQPIKTGEHRAKVEIDMGEYKVTRKFLGTNSTLTVETTGETKSKVSSPQAFLDKIVGAISFDPMAFMKKTPAEQRNALMEFLGLNLDVFDNKIEALKTERSDVRKEKERKLYEVDSIAFTPGIPVVEQSADELLKKLETIRKYNEQCQRVETDNAVTASQLVTIREDIDAAQKAIEAWKKKVASLITMKTELEKQIKPSPILENPAEVEAKIKSLGDTNEAIRRNNRKKQAMVEYETHCKAYSDLGEQVKMTEASKARKMAEAIMPVKGLTIQSDGLAFEGIPLEQVNDAKKLEICVAIAMAFNPELKVLRINGNDLDKDSLATIGKLITDKDYQVWIEKMTDENTIGFYIEDGTLTETRKVENQ
uniref:Putative ATPase domain containing protein n=1 Tax=viral metagenome TaxID=1070528 RepID=A0A6M3JAM5_9ZZZZ